MTAARQTRSKRARTGPWVGRAHRLAQRIALARLHPAAVAEIRRAAAAGESVALACSGGADSVALLAVLWAHLPEVRGRWVVLHFDHRLRGRASAADARFVGAVARGLGERVVVERWSNSGGDTPSEAEARDARFAFFARAMHARGARVLVLGHHADDVVETMVMRLVRGSATAGLAAPRPVHRRADGTVRVRPLLEIGRAELRAALGDAGVPWREDASNAGDHYLRNRLRSRVIPMLQQAAGRDLATGFLAARQALEDDDAALEKWLEETAGVAPERTWRALAGKPRALARRAVQAWLTARRVTKLSRSVSEMLVEAVVAGRSVRLSAGADQFIVFDCGAMTLENTTAQTIGWGEGRDLHVGGSLEGPGGDIVASEVRRLTPSLRCAIMAGRFPATRQVFLDTGIPCFRVRQRRAGDRYRPLGAPGSGRLQDLLINRKIPHSRRDALPVVCDPQDRPIWVPGVAPAADMAVHHGTKLVVQLTYTPAGAIVASP